MVQEVYGAIGVYRRVAVGRAGRVRGGSRLRAVQNGDTEKLSAYECGFNPFDDARARFDVRFYLVTMLFIIFDVEAAYRRPWGRTLGEQTQLGYRTLVDFRVERVIGYLYAWRVGAREWE